MTIASGVLFIFKTYRLDANLKRILYFDYKGYNAKKMSPEEYFLDSSRSKENEGKNSVEPQPKDVGIYNIDNNVLHFKQNKAIITTDREESNLDKNTVDNKHMSKQAQLVTLLDYEELEPAEALIYDKRKIFAYLKDKLILEHPILAMILKKSLKEPLFLLLLQFEIVISMQFAINAMLYTDAYIDNRQNDDNSVK
jgi:hypothetical protein